MAGTLLRDGRIRREILARVECALADDGAAVFPLACNPAGSTDLTINLTPVADRDDDDHQPAVLDLRDHAIVADAIAPVPCVVADESVAALAGISNWATSVIARVMRSASACLMSILRSCLGA